MMGWLGMRSRMMGKRIESTIGKGRSIVHYQIGDITLECVITDFCISIANSCSVHDDDMKREVLSDLLGLFPEFGEHRKMTDLVDEWRAHNILYRWGIEPKRTCSVDLEARQDIFHHVGYWLVSRLFSDHEGNNRDNIIPPTAPAC